MRRAAAAASVASLAPTTAAAAAVTAAAGSRRVQLVDGKWSLDRYLHGYSVINHTGPALASVRPSMRPAYS